MGFKKKLHTLDPKKDKERELKVCVTKERAKTIKVTASKNETKVRELLSNKISGVFVGLWLLVAEHLRLGTWDLIKSWTACNDHDISPRIAMQIVNESALCVSGFRERHCLCNQGFEVLNGLSYVVSDEDVHLLLNKHTVQDAIQMQENLCRLRLIAGHYKWNLLAIDPHRIITYSQRMMPKKRKTPEASPEKMLQTFFCIDAQTGQPLVHTLGSTGLSTTKATIALLEMIGNILPHQVLILADKEHFSETLLVSIKDIPLFDAIVPTPQTSKVKGLAASLNYEKMWAGYAIAQTDYLFKGSKKPFFLLSERIGEIPDKYFYKSFISTTNKDALKMLAEDYDQRWTIEEFFNFEGNLGWNRASTMNLNIRYGKMSLALMAQAANYQLRQKLPAPYKQWTAKSLADNLFRGMDGDIKVVDDTILVTVYNAPKNLNLEQHYKNLPAKLMAENVDPHIPWLFGFKLNFLFK